MTHNRQPWCNISRPAGPGYIVAFAGAPAVEVRAGGAEVKLGGRAWTAHVIEDDALQLTIVTPSDNGRKRVAQLVAGNKHEVQQRNLEIEALGEQQVQLVAAIEEVNNKQKQ